MKPKRTHGQTKEARARTQAKYNSSPEQKAKRASRGRARYSMEQAGKVSVGDGKDVAHKNDNPQDNKMRNLLVQAPSKNRSFKRNSKGGHKK